MAGRRFFWTFLALLASVERCYSQSRLDEPRSMSLLATDQPSVYHGQSWLHPL